MFDQWDELQELYDQLNLELAQQDLDKSRRAKVQKKLAVITEVLSKHKEIEQAQNTIFETNEQKNSVNDDELIAMFDAELEELEASWSTLKSELDELLYPADEFSNRSAYLEIRAGAGGKEAALFAGDLLKMYIQYASKRGWKTTIINESGTDLGGFKEVIVHVTGKNVYGELQNDSGVHRVQRVPETETSGRVHTSTATVAVLPEADEVDVSINPSDLRIDVFRASGAGGQHVNTTDSAVRITHVPSGVVVSCQDERSQHKNKAKAMKVLSSRLLAHAQEESKKKQSQNRKAQVGSGDRSEKIRTYNYPQNRVTDHQIGLTLKKLDMVMLGELDEIVAALKKMNSLSRKSESTLLDPIE